MTTTMPTLEDVRAEVKTWLEESWNPDLTVAEWWDILARSRHAAPTFPVDAWGKGWTRHRAAVGSQAIVEHRASGPPAGPGYLRTAATDGPRGNGPPKA